MGMIAAILMAVACIAVLYFYRGNQIRLMGCFTCIYLITLTIMQEMDVPFTIYIIFMAVSLFPIKRIPQFAICYFLFVAVYAVIGLCFQEFWNSASVLLTRYVFLFFGLVQCIKTIASKETAEQDCLFTVRIGTLTEIILAIYLLIFGDLDNRLAINSQAIGGAIAIGLFPLLCALVLWNKENWKKHKLYLYFLINLIIVVISGTRGYMVMAVLTILPLCCVRGVKLLQNKKVRIVAIIAVVCIVGVFIFSSAARDLVLNTFRLNESVGYRVNENIFIKKIYAAEPWPNKLFGFGIGGRANGVEGYYQIILEAAADKTWMINKLMTESTVHNYWYTILFKQGAIGLLLCGAAFLMLLTKIGRIFQKSRIMCVTLAAMFLGIVISLTFRISATCGVWETMTMLWTAELFNSYGGEEIQVSRDNQ